MTLEDRELHLDFAYACELRQVKRSRWIEFHGFNAGEFKIRPRDKFYTLLRQQVDAADPRGFLLTVYGYDRDGLDRGTPIPGKGERIMGSLLVTMRDNVITLAG